MFIIFHVGEAHSPYGNIPYISHNNPHITHPLWGWVCCFAAQKEWKSLIQAHLMNYVWDALSIRIDPLTLVICLISIHHTDFSRLPHAIIPLPRSSERFR